MLAQPLKLAYSSEEEKKLREKENEEKIRRSKEILEKAKEKLNANDLEAQIDKKVLELKILKNWTHYTNEDSIIPDNETKELPVKKKKKENLVEYASDKELECLVILVNGIQGE